MALYSVEALSLSTIGDLLRERLGDQVDDYVFPDEFEKAVVDIGFCGAVFDGEASPYDAVYIGEALSKMNMLPASAAMPVKYKKAKLIKTVTLPDRAFANQNYLTEIDLGDSLIDVGGSAFLGCTALESITFPETTHRLVGAISSNSSGIFYNCTALETVIAPGVTYIGGGATNTRGVFNNCTGLKNAQFGSVGNTVTFIGSYEFQNCTNAELVMTIYTTESYVDTLVSRIRGGATNATIIVKASENTTYNGVDYSAGDTILTSTP